MAERNGPRATSEAPNNYDDIWDEFLADLENNPNPGANSGPDKTNGSGQPKRARSAGPGDLGLDQEINLNKVVRRPRVKLDDTRLLSKDGIQKLRTKARDVKFKGKGHEWSDADKLINFFRVWLDGLYPKAKFVDALAMVEKAGHKKSMHIARMGFINEDKPKSSFEADAEMENGDGSAVQEGPAQDAPIDIEGEEIPDDLLQPSIEADEHETARPSRAPVVAPVIDSMLVLGKKKTPDPSDLLDGEDIYNATPMVKVHVGGIEEEDLDALMALDAAEAEDMRPPARRTTPPGSIFGSGLGKGAAPASAPAITKTAKKPRVLEDYGDDDAEMAMYDAESAESSASAAVSAARPLSVAGRRTTPVEGPPSSFTANGSDPLLARGVVQGLSSTADPGIRYTTPESIGDQDEDVDQDTEMEAAEPEPEPEPGSSRPEMSAKARGKQKEVVSFARPLRPAPCQRQVSSDWDAMQVATDEREDTVAAGPIHVATVPQRRARGLAARSQLLDETEGVESGGDEGEEYEDAKGGNNGIMGSSPHPPLHGVGPLPHRGGAGSPRFNQARFQAVFDEDNYQEEDENGELDLETINAIIAMEERETTRATFLAGPSNS